MSKTKEEIIEHLTQCELGYKYLHSWMIMAYLFGKGILTEDEPISIKEGKLEFADFVEWMEELSDEESDRNDELALISLIEDVVELAEFSRDPERIERHLSQLEYLATLAERMGYTKFEKEEQ